MHVYMLPYTTAFCLRLAEIHSLSHAHTVNILTRAGQRLLVRSHCCIQHIYSVQLSHLFRKVHGFRLCVPLYLCVLFHFWVASIPGHRAIAKW